MGKAVVSLKTGLEDAETVTVAMLMAVGAAESGRPTAVFLAKEAVRLALDGVAVGTACEGCPPLTSLFERYAAAAWNSAQSRHGWFSRAFSRYGASSSTSSARRAIGKDAETPMCCRSPASL